VSRSRPLLALAAAAVCLAAAPTPSPAAEPAAPRPASHGAPRAARPRLVFFMNPNGAPCQLQDRILREMGPDLHARADLVYVRTTEPGDLAQFGRYGIRALPTLVVTDAEGRELRRATPGIQAAEQVKRLLGG
jgi:thioredoxin 1